jgi:hypothetical protein
MKQKYIPHLGQWLKPPPMRLPQASQGLKIISSILYQLSVPLFQQLLHCLGFLSVGEAEEPDSAAQPLGYDAFLLQHRQMLHGSCVAGAQPLLKICSFQLPQLEQQLQDLHP